MKKRKIPEDLKKRCRAARVSLRTPKTKKLRKSSTLRRMCRSRKKNSGIKRTNDAKEFARYRTLSQAEIAALKKERDMVTAQLEEQIRAAGITDKATMDRLHAVEEELAKAIGDFQDCATNNEAIQQRLIQSVGQYEECAEQLQRTQDEMLGIENLRADLEQELAKARAQHKDCSHEKEDLEKHVEDLKSDIKECRRAHKDRSITIDEKQQIENLRADLEQELKNTRAQLKDCKKAHKGRDTGDKLRTDLEKHVEDLKSDIKECRRAHKDRSGTDKENQRQLNILDRTINDLQKKLEESMNREATCKSAYDRRGELLEKKKYKITKIQSNMEKVILKAEERLAQNEQYRTELEKCNISAAKLKKLALADYNSKVDEWKVCDLENRRLQKQLEVQSRKGRISEAKYREVSANAKNRERELQTELDNLRIQGDIGNLIMQEPAESVPTKQGGATTEDIRRAEIIAREGQGSLVMGFGNYDLPLFNKFFD